MHQLLHVFLQTAVLCFIYGFATAQFGQHLTFDTVNIITKHGYIAETHSVETEDGYILNMHRIPSNKEGVKGKQPVFLQHGLGRSSNNWVLVAGSSLAFFLADEGYDVWMGNSRGNFYSRSHVNLSSADPKFWNFSFHEMGLYDLPASLNYIANKTETYGEILYVGHSQGCASFFVFASMLPETAKNVKATIAVSPAVFLSNIKSLYRPAAYIARHYEWLLHLLGIYEITLDGNILYIIANICVQSNFSYGICKTIEFAIYGYDNEITRSNFPLLIDTMSTRNSVKDLIHYVQLIVSNNSFQMYDYGKRGNLKQYGTKYAPKYNLGKVTVPVYIFDGATDYIIIPEDAKLVAKEVPSSKGYFELPIGFNHMSVLWGKDARKVLHIPILHIFKQYAQAGSK